MSILGPLGFVEQIRQRWSEKRAWLAAVGSSGCSRSRQQWARRGSPRRRVSQGRTRGARAGSPRGGSGMPATQPIIAARQMRMPEWCVAPRACGRRSAFRARAGEVRGPPALRMRNAQGSGRKLPVDRGASSPSEIHQTESCDAAGSARGGEVGRMGRITHHRSKGIYDLAFHAETREKFDGGVYFKSQFCKIHREVFQKSIF